MSQVGFTPISLYYSSTASATPTAGNLVAGELAINTADGRLFYKDSSGVVQTIASKAGALGDVVGPASATDNALARFDTTTGKLIQNSIAILTDAGALSGLTSLSTVDLAYTGTLTGGTGIVNLGSGQFYKDGSGNIGVGTASPTVKLDVQGKQRTFSTSASTVDNLFQNSLSNLAVGILNTGNGYIDVVNNYALQILTNDTERMRITSAGDVGIGTSTPAVKLDVAGPIKTLGYTVATLPTGVTGMKTYVTDALAPTFGATVVGGGAVTIPVFYNGTNWIVG